MAINLQNNPALSDVGAAYLAIGITRGSGIVDLCIGGGRVGADGVAALGFAMLAVHRVINLDSDEDYPLPWLDARSALLPPDLAPLCTSAADVRSFVRERATSDGVGATAASAHRTHRCLVRALMRRDRVDDAVVACIDALVTFAAGRGGSARETRAWFHDAMKRAFVVKATSSLPGTASNSQLAAGGFSGTTVPAWRSAGSHTVRHTTAINPILAPESWTGMMVRVGKYYCPWYDVVTGAGGSKHFSFTSAWSRRET